MLPTSLIVSVLLIGWASGVTIEPENPVVRLGDPTQLMCKVRGPIKSCLWEINGELYTLQEGAKYQPVGNMQDGECGIQAYVTEQENGQWTCRLFLEGTVDRAQRASTNVTLLSLPQIQIRPSDNPITVIAGETSDLNCIVGNARPTPAILWMIGDREIDSSNRKTVAVPSRDGLTTITDTLRYAFQASDHGQTVRCITAGPWIREDDNHDTSAQLNVIFPAQPKEPSTLYGFVAGQPGDITVNFTANPRPIRVYWKIDETELVVEPFGGRMSNERFDASELRNTNASSYEARLRVKSVADSDSRRDFHLVVESELNSEPFLQDYIVRISMNAAPLQSGGVSGGGIAAIIIVLVAVLVVTAVVLYARNTGRWCFAGNGKTPGANAKESADEEAGQAVVEEAEELDGAVKVETNPKSFTHRLSSLYETLMSKAAPKKSSSSAGVGNSAADVEKRYNVQELQAKVRRAGFVPHRSLPAHSHTAVASTCLNRSRQRSLWSYRQAPRPTHPSARRVRRTRT